MILSKLTKFSQAWNHHPNCVTRASFREMYLRLYFEEYVVRC